MCGIVGAAARRDIVPLLIDGLRRLEYRGYDSAGIAVINHAALKRLRAPGRVSELAAEFQAALLVLHGLDIIGLKLRPPAGHHEEVRAAVGILALSAIYPEPTLLIGQAASLGLLLAALAGWLERHSTSRR